jgi:hypothetical protein
MLKRLKIYRKVKKNPVCSNACVATDAFYPTDDFTNFLGHFAFAAAERQQTGLTVLDNWLKIN